MFRVWLENAGRSGPVQIHWILANQGRNIGKGSKIRLTQAHSVMTRPAILWNQVITTIDDRAYGVRSAFTHLGLWRKVYDYSLHQFTTNQCVVLMVLYWNFHQPATGWKVEMWNGVFRPPICEVKGLNSTWGGIFDSVFTVASDQKQPVTSYPAPMYARPVWMCLQNLVILPLTVLDIYISEAVRFGIFDRFWTSITANRK